MGTGENKLKLGGIEFNGQMERPKSHQRIRPKTGRHEKPH